MKHLRKGNIAFWRYDLRPFISAKIVRVHNSAGYPGRGHIEAEGYGNGWFKPAFCLPEKEGMILAAKISMADNEHDQSVINSANRRTAKIAALLPKGVKVWRNSK